MCQASPIRSYEFCSPARCKQNRVATNDRLTRQGGIATPALSSADSHGGVGRAVPTANEKGTSDSSPFLFCDSIGLKWSDGKHGRQHFNNHHVPAMPKTMDVIIREHRKQVTWACHHCGIDCHSTSDDNPLARNRDGLFMLAKQSGIDNIPELKREISRFYGFACAVS